MCARPRRPSHRSDFHVAVLCALPLEANAVEELFDHFWDDDGAQYGKALGDPNAYRTGTIGAHNVVLVYMAGMGKGRASSVSASFRSSFQGIRLAMIVGICGAVPTATKRDIFLGDVVIGDEIVPYDHGRRYPTGLEMRPNSISISNAEAQSFIQKLGSGKGSTRLLLKARHHFALLQVRGQHYTRPINDRLFEPNYHHKHHKPSRCEKCSRDEACEKAQQTTCESLGCDSRRLIPRSRSSSSEAKSPIDARYQDFLVHFGRIASGDSVMKSGEERDRIAAQQKVLAFEMEGSGVCDNLPCIVVKGASDYADSHKDKGWQKLAAGTAAACMKALLEDWTPSDSPYLLPISMHDSPDYTRRENAPARAETHSLHHSNGPNGKLQPYPNACTCESPTFPICIATDSGEASSELVLFSVFPKVDASFQSAQECFKQYRKHLPRDIKTRTTLRTQRVIFSSNVHTMVTDASSSFDISPDIIKDSSHSIWSDIATHQGLVDRLGASYRTCLEVSLAIQAKLQDMVSIASSLSYNAPGVSAKAAGQPLKDAVEDLKSLIGVFASLVPPRRDAHHLDASPIQKKLKIPADFQHYRVIQEAACSLYDSLGIACNSHTVHEADLSLQPTISGTSSQVRFNVALRTSERAKGTHSGMAVWMNVESMIGSSAESTHYQPNPSFADTSALKRHREGQANSPPNAPKAPKRVRFHGALPEPPLMKFTAGGGSGIPDLYLQRNLCTVVERFCKERPLKCGGCIGQLGATQSCRHLLYMGNRKASSPTSLSQLISLSRTNSTNSLGLYERVRLSKHLAAAVLYYHATPWLTRPWRSGDIMFFGEGHELLEQAPDAIPYMSTSIDALGSSTNSTSASSEYGCIIRNPVLFGLGVMFLELAYQAAIPDLQKPIDVTRGETLGFADYFTAHRLAEGSHSKISQSFKNIVKKCLYCDFGHDSDFRSPSLQEAFYCDVIVGLEKLESVFREL